VEEAAGGFVVIEKLFFEDTFAGREMLRRNLLGRCGCLRLFLLVVFFRFFEDFFFYNGCVGMRGVLVCRLDLHSMDLFRRSALAELAGADWVNAVRDGGVFFRLVLCDDLLELRDRLGSLVDGLAVEVLRDTERKDSVLHLMLRGDGGLHGLGGRELSCLWSEALVLRERLIRRLFGALAVRARTTALIALTAAVTAIAVTAIATLATVVAGFRAAGFG
jgi:hypothetical protein